MATQTTTVTTGNNSSTASNNPAPLSVPNGPYFPDGTNADGRYLSPQIKNPLALMPFVKALAFAATVPVGVGAIGDSITEGASSSIPLVNGHMDMVRRGLQADSGGSGRGFVPCLLNSGGNWNNPVTGVQNNQVGIQTGTIGFQGRRSDGVGMDVVRIDAGSTGTITWTFDGTASNAEYRRDVFTAVYVCFAKNSNAAAVPWIVEDVTTGSPVTVASGTFNSNMGAAGSPLLVSGISNAGKIYRIRISAAPSGNVWLGGIVLTNGSTGIRFNSRPTWGARLVDDGTNAQGLIHLTDSTQRGVNLAANVGLFTSNFNEKLTFTGFGGTNDDTSGVVPTSDFLTGVNFEADYILTAGSVPVHVLHSASNGREGTYYGYNDQVLASTAVAAGKAAVIDLSGIMQRPTYGANSAGGYLFDLGMSVADVTHRGDKYQEWAAAQILNQLRDGIAYCRATGLA